MTSTATQAFASHARGGVDSEELFTAPARWTRLATDNLDMHGLRGPRHQTLRRKGIAPVYPKPVHLSDGERGVLVITRSSIVLRPYKPTGEVVTIDAEDMRLRVFYRNAAEILCDSERVVIGLSDQDAEVLDVLAQAYL